MRLRMLSGLEQPLASSCSSCCCHGPSSGIHSESRPTTWLQATARCLSSAYVSDPSCDLLAHPLKASAIRTQITPLKKQNPPGQRLWRWDSGALSISNFSAHSFPRAATNRHTRTSGILRLTRPRLRLFITVAPKSRQVILSDRPTGWQAEKSGFRNHLP